MNNNFINIGQFKITPDAFSILASGLLLIVVLFFNFGFKPIFLLFGLTYAISAYKVNCMIVGSCNFYAKFISIMTMIGVIFIIIDKKGLNDLFNKITK